MSATWQQSFVACDHAAATDNARRRRSATPAHNTGWCCCCKANKRLAPPLFIVESLVVKPPRPGVAFVPFRQMPAHAAARSLLAAAALANFPTPSRRKHLGKRDVLGHHRFFLPAPENPTCLEGSRGNHVELTSILPQLPKAEAVYYCESPFVRLRKLLGREAGQREGRRWYSRARHACARQMPNAQGSFFHRFVRGVGAKNMGSRDLGAHSGGGGGKTGRKIRMALLEWRHQQRGRVRKK